MNVLAVYNIKGGVGKTATAVNLAHLASREGLKVLLWDIDPQGASSYYFRVKARIRGGTKQLLQKNPMLMDLIKETDYAGLDLLPADFSYRHFDLKIGEDRKPHNQLKKVFKSARQEYDLLLIDCPPSISQVSEAIFKTVDALVVPTIPTTLSLRTLQQLLKFLKKNALDAIPVLAFFSMADLRKNLHKTVIAAQDDLKPWMMSSVIPYSSDIERMGINRQPITATSPGSRSALAYTRLWHEIGERLPDL